MKRSIMERTKRMTSEYSGLELAAERMTGAMVKLADQVEILTVRQDVIGAAQRRSRRFGIGLMISFVIDIALTILLAFFATSAENASHRALVSVNASKVSCTSSNIARAAALDNYEYLLTRPADNAADTALQQILLARIKVADAPLNCTIKP
jgi:hypothetical protein